MSDIKTILETIIENSNKELEKYSYLRRGQSIFNCTYKLLPEISNKLTGSKFDCYYDDTKIESFLKETMRLYQEIK
jgi:hypothetical protein